MNLKQYGLHRVVVVTGGFDPLHSGHLEYLKCAKALGEVLIVGLNSDDWLSRKKGKSFLPYYEREQILFNLKSVDNVINFADHDDSAVYSVARYFDSPSWLAKTIVVIIINNIPRRSFCLVISDFCPSYHMSFF